MSEDHFKKVLAHAKEYGFVFQSSEIYDGLAAVYDYGQNGVELKNNIRQYWWKSMVQLNENIVGLDASIFMAPKVWKASGHVDGFNDHLLRNRGIPSCFFWPRLAFNPITHQVFLYVATGAQAQATSITFAFR